ncbi:MAG: exopolysaccharide biosynthesis protein [Alphaproteobacteria bacterium]|nr:MAG: exopolysaccharide biosynthesis protein [Alphaproteobacteria bacterium]
MLGPTFGMGELFCCWIVSGVWGMTIALRGSGVSQRERSSHHLVRLRQRIEIALLDLVHGRKRPALLEFPAYDNVGDSAIWLGEIAFLADRLHVAPAHTSDTFSYSRERLAAVRDLDLILLSGGGNLGDLFKGFLEAKIRVLEDFPQVPIVQLPQTIHFRDPARLDMFRRAVARHRRFTLIARDRICFDMARETFDCDVRLCPDMALWLELPRPAPPVRDVACLLRSDVAINQSYLRDGRTVGEDMLVFDWSAAESGRFAVEAERALTRAMGLYPRKLAALESSLTLFRNRAAWSRVRRGCALLSSARVVVTDRLHGHILCTLMGIPHVILDNNYGKVTRFHESWTKDFPTVRLARSVDEALDTARAWLAELPSPGLAQTSRS